MDGFGSADFATPFSYGSVKDGYSNNPTLEQRLKKQYWKTKQTVRQKMNKREDEFVVAGDAFIDSKLEKAHHLQTSCSKLIRATKYTVYHTKSLSYYEQILGNYLASCGELDFTFAGQIMTKTGNMHKLNAETRLKQLPAFLRLEAETTTFATSGLGDLSFSIENLEKSRKEYRASLLWMKDASEKLHNPDAKGQLVRFREAQAQVKTTKERFEHLKGLLSEKIEMVSASRCNLLSNVLPVYQTAMLQYLDQSANELFKVLTELRSQTQHQYKVRELAQEIRDLEVDESNFETGGGVARTPELGETNTGENTPTSITPLQDTSQQMKKNKDSSLFGLLQGEVISGAGTEATPTKTTPAEPTPPKPSDDQLEETKKSALTGEDHASNEIPDDLGGLEDSLTQSNPTNDHLDGLLSLLDAPLESFGKHLGGEGGGAVGGAGDEWDTFMKLQQAQEEADDDGGWGEMVRHAQNEEESSGWSQSIMEGNDDAAALDREIDKLLTLDEPIPPNGNEEKDDLPNLEASFDPLASTEGMEQMVGGANGSHDLQLDPSLFQSQAPVSPISPPLIPQTTSPLALQQPSTVTPQPHPFSMYHTPSRMMDTMQQKQHDKGAFMGSKSVGGAAKSSENGNDSGGKKKNWMNVFAHLDPIANEKA